MSTGRKLFLALAMVLAVGWIYWPALHGGWVWDDKNEMPLVAALHGPGALGQIWLTPVTGDYYPAKTTLEWLEWRWWGNDTFGYHLVSAGLHAGAAVLLWRLLRRLGVRCARFGGLLFAVHPIAVESVAWIDELKNTLSLPFLLLAMILYVDFDQKGSGRECLNPAAGFKHSRPDPFYWTSLLCFLLAMLSKSSAVMFPLIILLYAWWKRGKIRAADLRSAAPFLVISVVLGLLTLRFQAEHGLGGGLAAAGFSLGGWTARTARAGLVASCYFLRCLAPFGLMPIYPRWQVAPGSLLPVLPWLVFGAAAGWCWARRETWGRHVLFGLGWFFLNLAPVLGFVAISHFRFTWTMDHLAYLPLAGLTGLAAAGLGALDLRWAAARPAWRWLALGSAAALCAVLAAASRREAAAFRSDETFWTYALERNPSAWLAENNLGNLLLERGEAPAAIGHFERALELNPDYPEAEYDLGLADAGLGRLPEAVAHYSASLRLQPGNGDGHNNLGNALLRLGRTPEALTEYAEAVRLQTDDVQARCNLGVALLRLGRSEEAIAQDEEALRLRPDWPPAHVGLGNAWARLGRLDAAIGQYAAALRATPDDADVHFNLGAALAQAGRRPEAIAQYREVLRLRPDDTDAREELRRAEAQP
jgi:tetratricopeptide (TPR) repeat protein